MVFTSTSFFSCGIYCDLQPINFIEIDGKQNHIFFQTISQKQWEIECIWFGEQAVERFFKK